MRQTAVFMLALLLTGPPCAAARKALVIGNERYTATGLTLETPIHDATDIGALLSTMQFAVDIRSDLDKVAFPKAVQDFVASLVEGDTALFYYSGHAIQINGQNLLWPVDAELASEDQALDDFVSTQLLYDGLRGARTSINIVILDACRDNPFAPTVLAPYIPGLALPRATPDSSFIAYATKENSIALAEPVGPGPRKHSPYTNAVLSQIGRTGVPMAQIFGDIRNIAAAMTGQIPVVENTLSEVFYFRPPVFLEARVDDVDDDAIVLLDDVPQFSTRSGVPSGSLPLHGGENRIAVKIFNQRSFTGGIEFLGGRRPEGWRYRATFTRDGIDLRLDASEDEPVKDGPRHGQLFTAAAFTVIVDDDSGSVRLDDSRLDRNAWQRAGTPEPQAPAGVLTASVRADLEWAASDSGAPGCRDEYLPHLDCLFVGQRACLIQRAATLARGNSPDEAFRLALVTQCENKAAQDAMRRAGAEVVNSWLRQLK